MPNWRYCSPLFFSSSAFFFYEICYSYQTNFVTTSSTIFKVYNVTIICLKFPMIVVIYGVFLER